MKENKVVDEWAENSCKTLIKLSQIIYELKEKPYIPTYINRPGYLFCEKHKVYYNGLEKSECPLCSNRHKVSQEILKKYGRNKTTPC